MFDDTNGYSGIPDALPSSYGYADAQPASVHQNMETAVTSNPFSGMGSAALVASNSNQPTVQPPQQQRSMPAGDIPMRIVSATPTQAANAPMKRSSAKPSYGAAAASAPAAYPVKQDSSGKKYREYKGDGGYVYAQYEDGSYAILSDGYDLVTKKRGGYPSGVKQGVPFTDKANAKAFNAIKAEVETAIGPFLSTAAVPAGGKQPVAFTPSGQATPANGAGDGSADVSWFQQTSLGVPNWGWTAVGTAAFLGLGYYGYRRFQASKQ